MNPRERMLRTLRGDVADRVPLDIGGIQFGSREALDSVEDPYVKTLGERAFDQSHFFVSVSSYGNRYLVTPGQRISGESRELPNGNTRREGVIDTPKGKLTFATEYSPSARTTWTLKYPVETREEIEKIASIPWELPEGLEPPSLEDLPDAFDTRGIFKTSVSSPFVCVAGMMTYESFLELCATDLDTIVELTEICRQRTLACLEVVLSKPGVEYVWMGGSEWVTAPMASPRVYDALVQEQERSIIDYVHEASDAVVHVHCHGNVRHALQRTIERGADFTEPVEPPPDGDITMAEAKELAAGRITLGGNVEARVLCNESEETTEVATRAAFEGGKERFVLRATEGMSPVLDEKEFRNWMRMLDVWEELSAIP